MKLIHTKKLLHFNVKNFRGLDLKRYKQQLKLTQDQKEILVGTLLGHSTIVKQRSNANFNIKFEQKIDQIDYMIHLYETFEPFVGTPPKVRNIKGGGAQPGQLVWFRTYRHIGFKFYYDLFYPSKTQLNRLVKKKTVPKGIHRLLTCQSLAYWYMDHGSCNQKNNSYYFNTQGFCYDDITILKKALKYNFDLDTNIYRDRNFYVLYIQCQCNDLFIKFIRPHMLKSFQYKFLVQDQDK